MRPSRGKYREGMTDHPAPDWKAVPELRRWSQDEAGPSLWHYVAEGGTFGHAVAVLALCSPELVEERGCVLLAEHLDQENFDTWWSSLRGRVADVERIVNHVHLWDVFSDLDDVPDQAVELFAARLATVWRAVLAHRFPDRAFVVEVDTAPDEYGPTVTFFRAP